MNFKCAYLGCNNVVKSVGAMHCQTCSENKHIVETLRRHSDEIKTNPLMDVGPITSSNIGNMGVGMSEKKSLTGIDATLAERGSRYGEFRDQAVIAQNIQDVLRNTSGWNRLAPDQKQALTVFSDKIARMLNGDPNYVDNWHDIIGYAKLVENRLNEKATSGSQGETH